MKLPLMPKATAIWLIENTSLSFIQIATFCGLHELEVQGIADGDVATGMQGYDPIDNKQLGGRIVGEIYADFIKPRYTKDSFERMRWSPFKQKTLLLIILWVY